MTSRERLLCAMHGGTPDRVPVAPFTMGRIDPQSAIGRDLIGGTDILVDCGAGGDPFLGGGAVVRREDGPDLSVVIVETPMGELRRTIRRTSVTSATVEFPFKSPEDVERFLSVPYSPPRMDLTSYHRWRDLIGSEGFVFVGIGNAVCLPADYFSPEAFCLCWAEAPDLMRRLVSAAATRLQAYVARLCDAGVDGFRIVGGEYVSVQLGHKAFADLVSPHDSALVDVMHAHGAIAYYHNHGRVMRFLPALTALGIDALDPLEATPWGDVVDLARARESAGPRLCFVGNLDDMEIVDRLPRAEVLEMAREVLRQAGSTAFILGGTASGTYGETGARNFIAMGQLAAGL